MKLVIILILGLFTHAAFAGMKCVGTTVTFHEDGTAESVETELKKIGGDKHFGSYYGESSVFNFSAHHNVTEKQISLEVTNKQNIIVIDNQNMRVAKFNVSIGGYWQTYFTSLNCTPTQN